VDELATLNLTASVTDSDTPANGLTYSLDTAPAGATIDPTTGLFDWTPSEADGPGGPYAVTVRVTDDGAPNLADTQTFNITVNEVNTAPRPFSQLLVIRRSRKRPR
jgi:hypothetical protein